MFDMLLPLAIGVNGAAPAHEAPGPALLMADRIVTSPLSVEPQINELEVRINSSTGVIWQGSLRVSQNQGASYSQNFSQASATICSANLPYDRSERSSVSFSVYPQNNGYGISYRFEASWQRPSEDAGCGDRGTRTVQVSKALVLSPGESGVIEGDAGLRVEVTRRR